MKKNIEITLSPEDASDENRISEIIEKELRIGSKDQYEVVKIKRSIDARSRNPLVKILLDVYINEHPPPEPVIKDNYKFSETGKKVIIVGAGPAGYFAALELIENGIKPVIFDRGKTVRDRRRDLRDIQQFSKVNPDSNYCFGEGGAGTYSDGKLYTRSHKRGDIYKALRIFVEHGAKQDILVDSHPHIGSNKLPGVVENIRETILHYGGEINFNSSVTDLIIDKGNIKGVIVNNSEEHFAEAVILATGHSARDIFYLLKEKNILIESKGFAMGIRIEHPQELIDEIQYKQNPRSEFLPASSYRLAAQIENKGVFSFCMCPGGLIVPAATSPGEIVVNGMSLSRRDSPYANSGIVSAIEKDDLVDFESHEEFSGVEYQKSVEQNFFNAGDGSQKAPSQRMTDFINGKVSSTLPETSYIPGIYSSDLTNLLPAHLSKRIKLGLIEFGKKMRGYLTDDAVLIGLESRTSSPVRIPRDNVSYEHVQVKHLYPCGEGAGYAGGIISAAFDGQNVAKAIVKKMS